MDEEERVTAVMIGALAEDIVSQVEKILATLVEKRDIEERG